MLISSVAHYPAMSAPLGRPDPIRDADAVRAPVARNDADGRQTSQVSLENRERTSTPVYSDPRVEGRRKAQEAAEHKQQLVDSTRIKELAARDREVRAHEQAHVAVGGRYAGAAVYQYERGPNGVSYAVGGEVSISVGPASTPEETLLKAQTIRRAALAPAEPSPQDRQVAAEASRLEAQARQELADNSEREPQTAKATAADSGAAPPDDGDSINSPATADRSPVASAGSVDPNNPLSSLSTFGRSDGPPGKPQFLTGYPLTRTIGGVIDSRA